jgi:hypothetical protein
MMLSSNAGKLPANGNVRRQGNAFIVNAISTDGEMDWFEGLLLVGAYSLLALAFFFSSPG